MKQLKIYIDPALLEDLKRRAADEGHSLAWILRCAIGDYISGAYKPGKVAKDKHTSAH